MEDSGQVNLAKVELASLQIKEHRALVVRARLKRMSCEATNMAQELRAKELRNAADQHIASVTLPDRQRRATNKAICKEFQQYFLKLFTREPGLSSAQFNTNLTVFPHLSATEAAGCEDCIMEDEVREALKSVGSNMSPGIDGLPYEVYLRLSHLFVPLLATIYNNWMRQGSIPRQV